MTIIKSIKTNLEYSMSVHSLSQESIQTITTATGVSPQAKSASRSSFKASGMTDLIFHPINAINQVIEQIQQQRQEELHQLLNRFTENGKYTLEENGRHILTSEMDTLQKAQAKTELTYMDMRGIRQIEKKFFGEDKLFEKRLAARKILEGLWPKDTKFGAEKMKLISDLNKVHILKGIYDRTGPWGELQNIIEFAEKRKVKYAVEDHLTGRSVNVGSKGEEKGYFDLLVAEGIITPSDKALLERFRDKEFSLDDRAIYRLQQLQAQVLKPRYNELQGIYERKGNWARFANLVESFKAPKLNYEITDYYFLKSFKVTSGGNKSYIDLFLDKGFLSAKDIDLLNRFLANKTHLDEEDIARLQDINNELISPLSLVFHEGSNHAAAKIFLPSDLKRIKEINAKKDFSSSDLRFLQGLLNKYYEEGSDFTNRKIRALRIFQKIYPNTPLNDSHHQLLETENGQRELRSKEQVYDREGEWKNVETTLNTLKSIRDEGMDFLEFLTVKGVITKEDREMFLAFLSPEKSTILGEGQRARIMKLYKEKLSIMAEALTNPAVGTAYKQVVSQNWLSKWELDHGRGLNISVHSVPHSPQVAATPLQPRTNMKLSKDKTSSPSPQRHQHMTDMPLPPPPPQRHQDMTDMPLPPPPPQRHQDMTDMPLPPPPPPPYPNMTQDQPLPPPPPPPLTVAPPPPPSAAKDEGRAELLDSIQKGKKLKHVSTHQKSAHTEPATTLPLANNEMLAMAIRNRRPAISGSNDNDSWD